MLTIQYTADYATAYTAPACRDCDFFDSIPLRNASEKEKKRAARVLNQSYTTSRGGASLQSA